MKRALLAALLPALALLLSACSASSLVPSATLVSSTPTPAPTPLPTAPPPVDQSNTTSFDNGAGNCVDAANQAIALIAGAAGASYAGTAFNMDMHLDLEPHGPRSGCDDSPAHIGYYRKYASSAALTVWPLDTLWYNAGPAIRGQWLADVLNALLHLYPRAQISVQVLYSGAQCGSASIGPGSGRNIDATC